MTHYRVDLALDAVQVVEWMEEVCYEGEYVMPHKDAALWWLATAEDGSLAGFAGLTFLNHTGELFCCLDGVMPQHRGAGLQRRLIRARCNWARANGYPGLMTYVMPHNVASLRNYLACGFFPYNPADPQWGLDVVYLTKLFPAM